MPPARQGRTAVPQTLDDSLTLRYRLGTAKTGLPHRSGSPA
ncbi:hypothetical protein [Nostoc sp.]